MMSVFKSILSYFKKKRYECKFNDCNADTYYYCILETSNGSVHCESFIGYKIDYKDKVIQLSFNDIGFIIKDVYDIKKVIIGEREIDNTTFISENVFSDIDLIATILKENKIICIYNSIEDQNVSV